MRDFFISYTKADLEWASWIAWELQEAAYTCTIQDRDFRPGQDFLGLMRRALKESRHTVAVFSPDYFESKFANMELQAALVQDPEGNTAKLIPVRVRECEIDPLLRSRIYIDLVGHADKEARRRLLDGVRAAITTMTGENLNFQAPPVFPGSTGKSVKEAPRLPAAGKSRILFVALDVGKGLDLRAQYRGLKSIFGTARNAKRYTFTGRFDVSSDNLIEALNKNTPNILHISGNQSGGRILIRDNSGNVTTIPDTALAGFLHSLKSHVQLVVIDTCNSARCARAAVRAVDLAIGVEGKIYDDDAMAFYETFYRALANKLSVAAAMNQASAKLAFKNVPKREIPRLWAGKGIDPAKVYIGGGA